MDTEETRAEIARRRLAQLVASFDEHVPPPAHGAPVAEPTTPPAVPVPAAPLHRRVTRLHVRVVVAVVVGAAVVLAWSVLSGRPQADPAGVGDAPAVSEATEGPVETGEIVVDVAGLVQRPGIVALPAGSRVHEAIEAAGGLAGVVDTSGLNLARKLVDGEQVLVGVAPVAPAGSGSTPGGATNLNTATADELDELPGVGPVTAQSIIDWRTENGSFTSVDDLLEVRGIGEATLADLRDLVTV
ncbi:ComEA family DNA-binding protein [Aeromicrobium sp. Leaf350]|uniref:ComEA family DNA-binding protein n=1 Tax=Aeromicrobium sp. Leaf350 TaxID=2876565 RepID=UPI001E53678B|nr:ComEA family DNA-binding protein [Aeromicrobium sp. Leaf350]